MSLAPTAVTPPRARVRDLAKRRIGGSLAGAAERALRRAPVRRGVVLVYHAVTDAPPPYRGGSVPAALFRDQLRHLGTRYRVVAPGDILAAAQSRAPGDRFPVALTFDDALASHRAVAAPLLAGMRFPAAFFLGIEDAGLADDLQARGFTIGDHAATHRALTGLDDAQLGVALRAAGGRSLLAYPYGASDERVRCAARRAGYRIAFTTRAQPVTRRTDPLAVGRLAPSSASLGDFALQLVRVLSKPPSTV